MTKQQPGFAVWITGLPASGKSTLTAALVEMLAGEGVSVQVLASDEMRQRLVPDLGYEKADRERFYRLLLAVGELLTQNGINVIFDATAAQRSLREQARRELARFVEVYVSCPLAVCEERDPKEIYRKAQTGLYHDVPGIQTAYEPPLNPEVRVDSDKCDLAQEAKKVIEELRRQGFLGRH
jgi:adenylylsulfate kinase